MAEGPPPAEHAERQPGGKKLRLPPLLPSGLLLGLPEASLWPDLAAIQRLLKSFKAEYATGWQSKWVCPSTKKVPGTNIQEKEGFWKMVSATKTPHFHFCFDSIVRKSSEQK